MLELGGYVNSLGDNVCCFVLLCVFLNFLIYYIDGKICFKFQDGY